MTSFASHSVFGIKDVSVLWPEPGLTQWNQLQDQVT